LLAVHNALILLASMRTEYHVRSCHFICGATYVEVKVAPPDRVVLRCLASN